MGFSLRDAGLVACRVGLLLSIAVPARAEDLLSLYREALLQDPEYQAARYSLEIAEQKAPEARAALLPTLSIVGGESKQKGEASFSEAPYEDREVRSRNWSLQLSQPLFRPAAWAGYRQADAQVRQAQAQFRQASQELILRCAQAYFDAVLAQESLSVALAQADAVEQQWILARRNFEVGIATVTDVHEAKSRLDLARSQKIAAENELAVRLSELEKIVGKPAQRLPALKPQAELPSPQPADVAAWVERSGSGSPGVAMLMAAAEASEYEVTRSRSGHVPTVDLNASYGTTYSSGSMTSPTDVPARSRSGQIGVQLTVPIWSGGAVSSRVAQAEAALGKARADLEAAKRQAATLVRQTYSGVVSGHAQIEALDSAVASSRDAVEANRIGYRIGTRINIDVLNAEQQLYTAKRDLVRAKTETLMQGLRLKAAVGELGDADVAAINQLLETPCGQSPCPMLPSPRNCVVWPNWPSNKPRQFCASCPCWARSPG